MSELIQTLSMPRWGKVMISGAMLGAIGYLMVAVAITIITPAPEGTGLYEYLWSLPLRPYGLMIQAGTYGCGLIGLVAGALLTADR